MTPMPGPLRVSPDNPRYFADRDGGIVYLTGSHTWPNLKDMGATDPPPRFDFNACLDFMEAHGHNFIRLWTWELTRYSYDGTPIFAHPFPWMRTGPGEALDGKPKFDLTRLDPAYFDRLRSRVRAACDRGIYASVMLFEGHGLHASLPPWCWDGHPFNARNNVNGIDGDPDRAGRGLETQTLQVPAVTALQETYARRVVDAVNDLDNVLYEIANESGAYSTAWQVHLIDLIHRYEQGKPRQHPVGMTFQYARDASGTNAALFNSPAEWISPNPAGGYRDDPPAADGSKVILTDTDHLWGIGGNTAWVWKSFCRGMNPLFMDPYLEARKAEGSAEKKTETWTDHLGEGPAPDPKWDPIRRNLGYTRSYADRRDLGEMVPRDDLSSTKYCLANPGREYLIYLPEGGTVSVDLAGASGDFDAEWFDPNAGTVRGAGKAKGGDRKFFTAPFEGDAILYLVRA